MDNVGEYKSLLKSCKERRCMYYGKMTDSCDYMLETGVRRGGICGFGEICTVGVRGEREKQRPRVVKNNDKGEQHEN